MLQIQLWPGCTENRTSIADVRAQRGHGGEVKLCGGAGIKALATRSSPLSVENASQSPAAVLKSVRARRIRIQHGLPANGIIGKSGRHLAGKLPIARLCRSFRLPGRMQPIIRFLRIKARQRGTCSSVKPWSNRRAVTDGQPVFPATCSDAGCGKPQHRRVAAAGRKVGVCLVPCAAIRAGHHRTTVLAWGGQTKRTPSRGRRCVVNRSASFRLSP